MTNIPVSTVHYSEQDRSINVWINGFEARFVQREDDYFIIYVSSQKGCDQSCRMCHLTATGQTDNTQATLLDYVQQVTSVLQVALDSGRLDKTLVDRVHINFMARGEPLLNPDVQEWTRLESALTEIIVRGLKRQLPVHYLVSTVFPKEIPLSEYSIMFSGLVGSDNPPRIYYSAYPMNTPELRKKWLGKAEEIQYGLLHMNAYRSTLLSRGLPPDNIRNKIHFALIKGVNDDLNAHMEFAMDMVKYSGHQFPINLVRYNPYSEKYGEEASEETYQQVAELYREAGCEVKIIPRVGMDVKASCGTFLTVDDT